jgi:hypothetical protein
MFPDSHYMKTQGPKIFPLAVISLPISSYLIIPKGSSRFWHSTITMGATVPKTPIDKNHNLFVLKYKIGTAYDPFRMRLPASYS